MDQKIFLSQPWLIFYFLLTFSPLKKLPPTFTIEGMYQQKEVTSMPKSVYLHIPFCNRICPYCDFNKYVLKSQPVMDYLEAIKLEMETTVNKYPPKDIKTIFVGGGTPTTLNPEQMNFFLDSINEHFQPQSNDFEFTIEANPETITTELLQVMKEGGVNRLSFGVQTFDPELLRKLGRMHSPEDVFHSLKLAKEAGFDNVSIDLMFGLPNQTVDMLHETLDIAFDLEIPHFSSYSLKVEEGTFFHNLYQKDKLPLPSEEEEVSMYELLIERMQEKGYEQYEISNFARPGFQSGHNLTYWRNEEYYGVGAGAHGYVKGKRHINAGPLSEYIDLVKEKGLPYIDVHQVTQQEAMEEMMIMGLRIQEGVSQQRFFDRFGVSLKEVYGHILEKLLDQGLLQTNGSRYFLTRKGIFLGNEVFVLFLQDK
jgi:oxygen-independent coproporphyrinogen-3 oxidase